MKRIELHLLLGMLLLAGCHRKTPDAASPPPKVTVAPVIEKEIVEWNEFIGRTDAVESVEIRARVSGYLTSVDFKPGSLVKKGDLLFTIDERPYKADLARAQGQLEQAALSRNWPNWIFSGSRNCAPAASWQ